MSKEAVASWEYDAKPLLVFWETTKACLLACRHCRAEALQKPLPGELNTDEGYRLIDQILEFENPLPTMIFSGGDPLMRKDIRGLLSYAIKKGLRVAVAPSVTPLLNRQTLEEIYATGVRVVSLSLDGATAHTHDGIRGIQGTWRNTLKTIEDAVKLGFRIQVNTAVMRTNTLELADIFNLTRRLNVWAWEVFFLVKTGRGVELEDPSPQAYEATMHFLYDAAHYGVTIRTSEAPHFRRVIAERNKASSSKPVNLPPIYEVLTKRLIELVGVPNDELNAHPAATRDGKGIVFIAHDGAVYPSGFLPLTGGNIRETSLKKIYCESALFKQLRHSPALKGKCGRCEYRDLCGGSRARAYAEYHDPLQEDPACIYEPTIS